MNAYSTHRVIRLGLEPKIELCTEGLLATYCCYKLPYNLVTQNKSNHLFSLAVSCVKYP